MKIKRKTFVRALAVLAGMAGIAGVAVALWSLLARKGEGGTGLGVGPEGQVFSS